ncbi:MAG: hypothetical protein C0407_15785 [Desulfobacca sp.]|nr:hypothetical protein [Desulfobacca sp.]
MPILFPLPFSRACPRCRGLLRIISISEEQELIDKILGHVGLWQTKQGLPPKPKTLEFQMD